MDKEFTADLLLDILEAIKKKSKSPIDFVRYGATVGTSLIISSILTIKDKDQKMEAIDCLIKDLKQSMENLDQQTSKIRVMADVIEKLNEE